MDDWLGRVVSSLAGRDKGKLFIVVDSSENKYLTLVDGNLRKLEKPKTKKVKHVKITDICFEELGTKIRKRDKITNAELRKALKSVEIVDLTK